MPELPEVEVIARTLARRVVGDTFTAVWARTCLALKPSRRAFLEVLGAGATVHAVARKGKVLLFELSGEWVWAVRLGMSGRVLLKRDPHPHDLHTHLVVRLGSGWALHYRDPRRFGRLAVYRASDLRAGRALATVGPDCLRVSLARFHALIASRGASIKAVLLNQAVVSGLGNIYADEALHRSRIDPRRPARTLQPEEVAGLHHTIRGLLREACRAGGSSVRDFCDPLGRKGRFQERHLVYGRGGQPCSRCGEVIERAQVAGRTTAWCPVCQT